MGEDGIREVGGVPHKEYRGRKAQTPRRRDPDWKDKPDLYHVIRRIIEEYGYGDDAWWHVDRSIDTLFRKEGRAIVQPNSWDQFTITPLENEAILLTDIIFSFPEPIGRQFATVVLRHKGFNKVLTHKQSTQGGGVGAGTIYDSMLYYRFLTVLTEPLAFRITNASPLANAIVDFDIRGKIIAGTFKKVRR